MTTRIDPPQPDDAGIEELLRQVGARSEPSAEMEREVYSVIHAEWRSLIGGRQRNRRLAAWAVAASFVLAVLIATLSLRSMVAPPPTMATVARVEGTLSAGTEDGTTRKLEAGAQISLGERLSTNADARAALTVGSGLSLRVDHDTILHFAAHDRVTLEAGAVYVDDPPSTSRTPLTIAFRTGSVTHVGTQYLVRDARTGIEVSVREGRVLVTTPAGVDAGVAGEQLRVTTAGAVAKVKIASTGDLWTWAEQAAPTFDIGERSLATFLAWVARETGRELVYEDAKAEAAAAEATLHGSIAGLDLHTALTTVLSTTQLREYPAGKDRIGIRLAASPGSTH